MALTPMVVHLNLTPNISLHLYVGGTPVESKSTRSLSQARASDHVIIVGLFR